MNDGDDEDELDALFNAKPADESPRQPDSSDDDGDLSPGARAAKKLLISEDLEKRVKSKSKDEPEVAMEAGPALPPGGL